MMVTEVTAGLQGVVCHMDNILIWGTTKEQHDTRVHAVLQRAEKAGVTLNMAKCEFGKREIVPGLHCLSRWREARSRKKNRAVQDMKEPPQYNYMILTSHRKYLLMPHHMG